MSFTTSSLSCELSVADRPRGDALGLLVSGRVMDAARSLDSGPPGGLACLIGDEALELVFIEPGSRGISKKLPG
jgi:hypothetical protein